MKNLFVPYKIALQLKEKGFNEECIGYWWDKNWMRDTQKEVKEVHHLSLPTNHNKLPSRVSSILYQQVIDWFREKHNIMLELHWQEGTQNYSFCYGYKAGKWFFPKETSNYYQSLNKAIEEALKLT